MGNKNKPAKKQNRERLQKATKIRMRALGEWERGLFREFFREGKVSIIKKDVGYLQR